MEKAIIKKYLFSLTLMLIIVLFMIAGAVWLIVREFPEEGRSNYYIIKNRAGRITGVMGLFLTAPWILAIAKNIILLFCDLVSGEKINLNIKVQSDLTYYLPRHSFYVIDSFDIKSKFLALFLFWYYVFSHSYYFLDMDMANVSDLELKKNVKIVATKYAHIILSIQK